MLKPDCGSLVLPQPAFVEKRAKGFIKSAF